VAARVAKNAPETAQWESQSIPAGGLAEPLDLAQDRPFDLAQDRPFDLAQDRPFESLRRLQGEWLCLLSNERKSA
jgi:hypothetical protein